VYDGFKMKLPIYMDHHSTTPLDPRVLEAMMPYLTEKFGNASSKSHVFGWQAEAAVTKARGQVASIIGASPQEIIFTSGATESDNLALFGIARAYREKGDHLITGATEHHAVLDAARSLEKEGFRVTYLPADRYGRVSPDQVQKALTDRTILVSLMAANNEIGTLHPLEEIGRVVREKGVLFHTDAAQALGRIPLDVNSLNLDLLSLSGHKIYGPKGIGALYLRKKPQRIRLDPIFQGGGHEEGLRSGTLNVPGIVGLGMACTLAGEVMAAENERLRGLRDKLFRHLSEGLKGVHLNGHPTERLSNNLNLSFEGIQSDGLMMEMKDVALSSGSACTSARPEPSYVLKAIGVGEDLARGSLRFGLGRSTTEEEIDYVAKRCLSAVNKLREGTGVRGELNY